MLAAASSDSVLPQIMRKLEAMGVSKRGADRKYIVDGSLCWQRALRLE